MFQNIANITIPVSISVVILILFKKTCLKRIPSKWNLICWIPILLQLMIPIQLKIPIHSRVPIAINEVQTTVIQISKRMEAIIEPAAIEKSSIPFSIHSEMIWMLGMLVMSILFLRLVLLFNKRIQFEAEECQDDRVHAFIPETLKIRPVVLPHINSAALPLVR